MLNQAILAGNLPEVEAAVDQGADVNTRLDGRLPLCVAISNGEEEVAIYLLFQGTDLTLPPPPFPRHGLDDAPAAATAESIFSKCRGVVETLQVYYHQSFVSQQPLEEAHAAFGGVEVVEAILGSAFKSERLVVALLDQMEFPPDYVQQSLIYGETFLAKLWLTAAEEGYHIVIRRLIALGIPTDFDVSSLDWLFLPDEGHFGLTALAVAASKGHLALARTLLEHGADVNAQTEPEAATPLIRALHSRGASSSQSDGSQSDVQLRLVELLLDHNASINAVDHNGRSPLSHAAENSSLDAFKLLLRRGADASTADKKGRTVVHFASGRQDAAKFLAYLDELDVGLDRVDDDGYTPFLRAVRSERVDLAEHLLQRGADPLVRTASGLTALQLTASYGPPRMLELLVSTGIDVNYAGKDERSALVRACSRHIGRALPLSILLEAGADANGNDNALSGWPRGTPLHIVCREMSYCWSDTTNYQDQLDSIQLLINHGANVNQTYTDPRMALEKDVSPIGLVASHAPDSIKLGALKALLEAGARPDGRDDRGLPALLGLCAEPGSIEGGGTEQQCVELLIQHGADVAVRDQDGMTCLHHAAYSHNFSALGACAKRLRSRDPSTDTVDLKDSLGRTALHIACSDEYWMTQSQYQVWSEHQSSGDDYANWHVSLESSLVLRVLHAAEADPYSQDSHKATTLHIAAKACNPRIMATLLLWTGPSLLFDFPDRCKRLAFHYAVRSVEVTKMLLHYYAHNTVEHQDYFEVLNLAESSNSSLARAKSRIVERVFEELGKRKYQLRHPDAVWNEQEYPRPWRRGAFNQQDEFGNTPLHYAALAGSTAVARLYLNMPGLDLSATNVDGETALDYASEHRGCVMAILAKAPGLSASSPRQESQGAGSKTNKPGRQASIEFISQLGKSHLWGVYRDRDP
ncbi:hypothetical protein ACJ41O_006697 [Fusarium nematophilum]